MDMQTDVIVDGMDGNQTPHWRHVGAFLGLTFGLTWLLNLAIYLRGGLGIPGMLPILQLQMLLPAFSAILLGLFFFPESPIYHRRPAGRGRWFYFYFLALTLIYALGCLMLWFSPGQSTLVLISVVTQLLALLGLIFLIVLRFVAGKQAMVRVWLSWGSWRYWLVMGVAIVVYYVAQAALNAVTGLGAARFAPPAAPQGMASSTFLILAVVQSVLLAPFLALVITFGEEYGWRGYLQTELFKMGRVRGVLLLGVIWGVWHWPIILMGYNYPGHPLLGVLLMTCYTIGLGIVLGYAVLKTGSVLLSAFLHGLNNQVVAFIFAMGFLPHDNAYSFGIGTYAVVTLSLPCSFCAIPSGAGRAAVCMSSLMRFHSLFPKARVACRHA